MKNRFDVASNIQDLATTAGKRVLVGGSLVYASLDGVSRAPAGYVAQEPREIVRDLIGRFRKNNPKVRIDVHPELCAQRTRVAFLLDAYLAYGSAHGKGELALIGGVESEGEVHVDVLIFSEGRLVVLQDFALPPVSSSRFASAADAVIARVKDMHPAASIVQCAPLSDWKRQDTEYIGDRPLRTLRFRPIERRVSLMRSLRWPALVVAVGSLANVGAIGFGWSEYAKAVRDYDLIAQDPELQSRGGADARYVGVMRQRRLFMETERSQDVLPSKILEIVRGISTIPKVQILELRLPAPYISQAPKGVLTVESSGKNLLNADRPPDALIRLSVPKTASPALEQARELLNSISSKTGMSLRLVHRGWQDEGDRRSFTIEGFIHV